MDLHKRNENGIQSPTFCILPWMHVHLWPDAQIFPCCAADNSKPLGSYSGQSKQEIFNLPKMREIRLKMLNGESCEECNRCYDQEKMNSKDSYRVHSNVRFAETIKEDVLQTAEDGSLPDPKLRFVDIRFSNLCNFKCRTCGPELSSGWFDDFNKRYAQMSGLPLRSEKVTEVKNTDKLLNPNLNDISHIYFAGGEPILMEQHLKLLEEIVEKSDPSKKKLMYNTNLSFLKRGKTDFIPIWKKFERVEIWASIDAAGKLGEFVRKGFNWNRFVENCRRIRSEAPEIEISISATLSVFNALHLPDLHRILVEEGLIEKNFFRINMLFDPAPLRVDRMPDEMRKFVVQKYIDHADNYFAPDDPGITRNMFLGAASFIDSGSSSELFMEQAKDEFRKLDQIRNEDIREFIPEIEHYYGSLDKKGIYSIFRNLFTERKGSPSSDSIETN